MIKKICLITGSTDGIGYQTALDLSTIGLDVILHGRSDTKTKSKAEEIEKITKNKVDYITADLSKFDEINEMCEQLKKRYKQMDVIILNAGIYHPNSKKIDYFVLPSQKKVETTLGVNHLSNFYLIKQLFPLLKQSSSSRIVHVSSIAHNNGKYNEKTIQTPKTSYEAYANSKLCNVIFSNTLSRKMKSLGIENITSNSLHPGVINTKLLSEMGFNGSTTLKEGAETSVYLSISDEVKNISGKYFIKKKVSDHNKIADDIPTQDSLWNLSEELLGFKFDFQEK